MSRPMSKIMELKKEYLACTNVEKEKIILNAIESIKALTVTPKGEGGIKDE